MSPRSDGSDGHVGIGRTGHFIRLDDHDETRFQTYRERTGLPAARQVILQALREFLDRNENNEGGAHG